MPGHAVHTMRRAVKVDQQLAASNGPKSLHVSLQQQFAKFGHEAAELVHEQAKLHVSLSLQMLP